jgi:hypothetical protein
MLRGFKEGDPTMRHQAIRTIALMLGVLLVTAPAAKAGTITFGDLVRTVGASGQLRPAAGETRLRFGVRSGTVTTPGNSTQSGANSSSSSEQQTTTTQQTPGGPTT